MPNMRWAIPLYYAGLMFVTARQTTVGDGSLLWFVHGLGALVFLLAVWPGGLGQEIVRLARSTFIPWLLVAFLAYFSIKAATHETVGGVYLRYLARDMLTPLAMGAVLFSPGKPNARLDMLGLLGSVILLLATTYMLSLHLREDLFLVRPFGGTLYYQQFGVQAAMWAVSLVTIFAAYVGPLARCRLDVWTVGVPTVLAVAFFAAQMVGSNAGSAFIGLLAFGVGVSGLVSAKNRVVIARSVVGALAVVSVSVALVLTVQPMRILQYRDVWAPAAVAVAEVAPDAATSDSSRPLLHNVQSRMRIVAESGVAQFLHSPITGDLAVDRIVTGGVGRYPHTIFSVFSHLGVIGGGLLFAFLVAASASAIKTDRRALVAVIAAPAFVLSLFSFFPWQPLWFLIGALCVLLATKPRGPAPAS